MHDDVRAKPQLYSTEITTHVIATFYITGCCLVEFRPGAWVREIMNFIQCCHIFGPIFIHEMLYI